LKTPGLVISGKLFARFGSQNSLILRLQETQGVSFKNPVIPAEQASALKEEYPSLKIFPAEEGFSKVPAAWLIDQCGFKGIRKGNVGVHEKQALVLLAFEGAKGKELLDLADEIRTAVKERFNIDIEPEVNIV